MKDLYVKLVEDVRFVCKTCERCKKDVSVYQMQRFVKDVKKNVKSVPDVEICELLLHC